MVLSDITPLPMPPCQVGESPMWHPQESALYWCDIPGRRLYRHQPATGEGMHWDFDSDVACCAPLLEGGLMLGLRSGLWQFDPRSGDRRRLAKPPYDPQKERFNDGKADPQGRFWVGTIYEPREPALAALYRHDAEGLHRMADGITTSNGLAWSPDARRMHWSDTRAHVIYIFDVDAVDGSLSNRQVFAQFPVKRAGQDLADYGGRPDGAAMDVEGCYWVAMFEGQRVLRLSPSGEVIFELQLPVRCPTMPCFGGPDLRTLYITTARENRPEAELAQQPWAGSVLQLRVAVPGMPTHYASLEAPG